MEISLAPTMRPYLLRALHEWCHDQGFTPYVLVAVDNHCQVPREYVQNDQIVLNVSTEATQSFFIDDEYMSFKGRFGGRAQEVFVPLVRIAAIYARENGQGMAFPVEVVTEKNVVSGANSHEDPPDEPKPTAGGRPNLRRVK